MGANHRAGQLGETGPLRLHTTPIVLTTNHMFAFGFEFAFGSVCRLSIRFSHLGSVLGSVILAQSFGLFSIRS